MGLVFKARDLQLGRFVAIKVLIAGSDESRRPPRAVHSGSPRRVVAEPSQHHHHPRHRHHRRRRMHRDGVRARQNAGDLIEARPDPDRRLPQTRHADRRRSGRRPRHRHRPSGSEARQRDGHARRPGQGSRFRSRQDCRRGDRRDALGAGFGESDTDHVDSPEQPARKRQKAPSSARSRTCLPSRRRVRKSMPAPTSFPSAQCFTRWSRASGLSTAFRPGYADRGTARQSAASFQRPAPTRRTKCRKSSCAACARIPISATSRWRM